MSATALRWGLIAAEVHRPMFVGWTACVVDVGGFVRGVFFGRMVPVFVQGLGGFTRRTMCPLARSMIELIGVLSLGCAAERLVESSGAAG